MTHEISQSVSQNLILPDRGIQVVNQRQGGLVEAFVPIKVVYREDVAVDETHVLELAGSIDAESRQGTHAGQLSPVLLGVVPDLSQLPIIDGFHRVAALDRLGRERVFATIKPDSSWEDIYDLRILTAVSHKTVQFARLMSWVDDAWERSPWNERLKASQAFTLKLPGMTGSRLGLSPDEATAIREWVDRKCEQWRVSPVKIYQNLSTAQIADPDLVQQARARAGGRTLEALTPQHLTAVAQTLPHRFELQREVASAAMEHRLTVRSTQALATAVSRAENPDQAREIIQSRSWQAFEPVYAVPMTVIRKERMPDEKVLDALLSAEIKIGQLTIDNAVLTRRYVPQEVIRRIGKEVSLGAVREEEVRVSQKLEQSPKIELTAEQFQNLATQIDSFRPQLEGYVHNKFSINGEDASDVVSEGILKALVQIKKGNFEYRGEAQLMSWILRVISGGVVDNVRKTTIEGNYGLLDREERFSDAKEQMGLYPKAQVTEDSDEEYLALIKQALPDLQEPERRLLILREIYHLEYSELAQILGDPPTTLRVRTHRVRQRMGRLLASYA